MHKPNHSPSYKWGLTEIAPGSTLGNVRYITSKWFRTRKSLEAYAFVSGIPVCNYGVCRWGA